MAAGGWLGASCLLALVACGNADDETPDAGAEAGDAAGLVDRSTSGHDAQDAAPSTRGDDSGNGPDATLDATADAADAASADAREAGADAHDSAPDAPDGTTEAQDATADAPMEAMPPVLVGVIVTPRDTSVSIGCGPQQLRATASYSDGTTADVTSTAQWTVMPSGNVSVDVHGKFMCLGAGVGSVQALYAGVTGTSTVVCAAGTLLVVEVFPASASLPRGGALQYTAIAIDSASARCDVTPNSTWQSSASGVASVSDAGLATAAGEGGAVISATMGTLTGQADLTVTGADGGTTADAGADSGPDASPPCSAPDAAVLQVLPQNPTIAVGTLLQFVPTAFPDDHGTMCDLPSGVVWQSSSPSVAAVTGGSSSGLVKGLSAGTATITATIGGVTSTSVLTVE